MSRTPGLVRVTVSSGSRRVDLVLPGAVPVVELLPELVRSVGLLDPATVYGGYRLVTAEGHVLGGAAGLSLQGVQDGCVIIVAAGADDPPVPVYDDVVEAMSDVVEHELTPWRPESGRRTALVAAVLLLALGAAALLAEDRSPLAGAAAAVVAAVLAAGAVVLSRAQQEQEAAVTLAWTAAAYAACAGYLLGPDEAFLAYPVACAGAGAVVVGLVCLLGLDAGRPLVLPLLVTGAVFTGTGVLEQGSDVSASALLSVILVVVVLAGSTLPRLALGVTRTRVPQLYSATDITAEPEPVDPDRVTTDARTAHEILLAISATVGALVVLVTPVVVSRGAAGTLLTVLACVVVMCRTRQVRTGTEVLVGLGSGIAGLASAVVSVLVEWPEWRPTIAVVLAAAGAALLAATLVSAGPSVRRGRAGDVLESVALLALLPLLVVASGLFATITG